MKFYWNIKIYVQYIFDGDIVMQNWFQVISSEIDSIEFGKKLKLFIYPYNLSTKYFGILQNKVDSNAR